MFEQAIVLLGDAKTGTMSPHTTRVAGLSMLKRTLVMLQWAGVGEALIVAPSDALREARDTLVGDGDLDPARMTVLWARDREYERRGSLAVAPVESRVRGRVVVLRADTVYDRELLRDVGREEIPAGQLLSVTKDGKPVGLFAGDAEAVRRLNGYAVDTAACDIVRSGGGLQKDLVSRFCVRINGAESIKEAEDNLWNSCRKPIDGIVARLLNRHVSLFISRRIAHLPIKPNHVSLVTFALGIGTAFAVAQGGYWWFLLGAFLFKLNSILDGVDGELARVRYQMSVLGEWMDTLSDDISNMLFFIALSIGAYRMSGDSMWVTLGLLTAVPSLLATAYQYTLLIRSGRGDLLAIKWLFERGNGKGEGESSAFSRFMDSLKYVVKKDFFVFLVFLVAIAGQLQWMLFLTTVVNLILLATVVIQEVLVRTKQRHGEAVDRVVTGVDATVPGTARSAHAESSSTSAPEPARR